MCFFFCFTDSSSSDEVFDSDKDPDFVPIGLLQKRKKTGANLDDLIDSDIENSLHGNEGGQQEKEEDGSVENGDIEKASGSKFHNNAG